MGLRVKSVFFFFLHFPSAEDGGTKVQERPGSPCCSQCGSLWQLRRRRRQQLCRPEEQEVALRHVLNKLHFGRRDVDPLACPPSAPLPPRPLPSTLARSHCSESELWSLQQRRLRPRRTGWKWMPDELVTSPGRTQTKKKSSTRAQVEHFFFSSFGVFLEIGGGRSRRLARKHTV